MGSNVRFFMSEYRQAPRAGGCVVVRKKKLRLNAELYVRSAAPRTFWVLDATARLSRTLPVIMHGILVWRWFVCECMEDDQRL